MTLEVLHAVLGWCVVINAGLLAWWFLFFWLAHDWMYRFHGRMFRMSVETFDTIHYAGMAMLKIGVFLFNLVPYLALHLVSK